MRNKGKDTPQERQNKWLVTFNDMMTLLFAFFVLILSMSHFEAGKLDGAARAMRRMVGDKSLYSISANNKAPNVVPSLLDADIEREKMKNLRSAAVSWTATDMAELKNLLSQWDGLTLVSRKDGLVLMMSEPLLFTSGSGDISEKGKRLLSSLAPILKRNNADILVEGHTDDIPVRGGRYPSNWELSIARAVNVVQELIATSIIAPARLSAAGYADTHPLQANSNADNRMLNRRVDIIMKFSSPGKRDK